MAALHSGYCVRRQYAESAGLGQGKNVRDFLDGLVTRQIATRATFRSDRGHVYHLFARSLYAALGQEHNRNRRHASPALIARKLMLLDFVLAQPDRDWFVTEREKIDLFTRRLGVPTHALPRRAYESALVDGDPTIRYFIHKLPIFLAGEPAHVHFVCLVTDPGAADVQIFIRDHRALVNRLSAWTLVAVRPSHIASDERCAAQLDGALRTRESAPASLDPAETRWFFEVRKRVDHGEFSALAVAEIARFRECSTRVGRRLDVAYSQWLQLGTPAIEALDSAPRPAPPAIDARLVVYQLPHRYEQFGALPGLS